MYRMSMLSFLIVDPNVNKDKLMKVCMVHDLAESIVGDITPHDGVSKEDKRKLEETALRKIIEDIEYPEIAAEILELWLEYEEGESPEAHLAREFDKFEMILQALEYEEIQPEKKLDSFFRSTEGYFHNPQVSPHAS
jgi:putative hydrolase of HD superfamily